MGFSIKMNFKLQQTPCQVEKTPRANCRHRKWANMEAALCGEQVQRGSRGCSAITQQDGGEGTDWSPAIRQEGEELRFLLLERSITALAWQWWVG